MRVTSSFAVALTIVMTLSGLAQVSSAQQTSDTTSRFRFVDSRSQSAEQASADRSQLKTAQPKTTQPQTQKPVRFEVDDLRMLKETLDMPRVAKAAFAQSQGQVLVPPPAASIQYSVPVVERPVPETTQAPAYTPAPQAYTSPANPSVRDRIIEDDRRRFEENRAFSAPLSRAENQDFLVNPDNYQVFPRGSDHQGFLPNLGLSNCECCDEWAGLCKFKDLDFECGCGGLKANPGHYGIKSLRGCDNCETTCGRTRIGKNGIQARCGQSCLSKRVDKAEGRIERRSCRQSCTTLDREDTGCGCSDCVLTRRQPRHCDCNSCTGSAPAPCGCSDCAQTTAHPAPQIVSSQCDCDDCQRDSSKWSLPVANGNFSRTPRRTPARSASTRNQANSTGRSGGLLDNYLR